jgi:hypothetical protein
MILRPHTFIDSLQAHHESRYLQVGSLQFRHGLCNLPSLPHGKTVSRHTHLARRVQLATLLNVRCLHAQATSTCQNCGIGSHRFLSKHFMCEGLTGPLTTASWAASQRQWSVTWQALHVERCQAATGASSSALHHQTASANILRRTVPAVLLPPRGSLEPCVVLAYTRISHNESDKLQMIPTRPPAGHEGEAFASVLLVHSEKNRTTTH